MSAFVESRLGPWAAPERPPFDTGEAILVYQDGRVFDARFESRDHGLAWVSPTTRSGRLILGCKSGDDAEQACVCLDACFRPSSPDDLRALSRRLVEYADACRQASKHYEWLAQKFAVHGPGTFGLPPSLEARKEVPVET